MPATVTSPSSGPRSDDAAQRVGDETETVAFGKYRLRQRIARGGMGEVYRASLVGELGFEKALVIKTILPELAAQSRFIDMFAAEAKTAVALSHGNIVPIYELGRAEDTFYIVMGYVDGPSVAQLLSTHRRRRHPPPLAVALSILRGVLSGLAYAHTEEPGRPAVVHRDITPRNVMIDRSGQVRIVDFGIAAPARAHAGINAGSVGYVAPEQARNEAVDPRADVFSSACLLYELLTLERAFPNKGVWTTPEMDKVPETMRKPLEDALALDPKSRPADASAFLQSLGAAITQYAATFTETDMAAHLRTIYPDGRWGPVSEPSEDEVTPSTVVRPTTMTFATRPIPISKEFAIPDLSDSSAGATASDTGRSETGIAAAPGRRLLVTVVGAVAAAAAVWWLWLRAPTDDGDGKGNPKVDPPAITNADPTRPKTSAAGVDPPDGDAGSDVADRARADLPPRVDPPPTMTLTVSPPEATVRIGKDRVEGSSPFTLPLPAEGTVKVTIEHSGHEAQTLELSAQSPAEQSIALQPVAKGRGYLQVLAPGVSWAEVTVDGRRRGVTPIRKLELSAGPHRVVVRCVPDVCPQARVLERRTVEIKANETARLTAK